jgi:hypothetical protein
VFWVIDGMVLMVVWLLLCLFAHVTPIAAVVRILVDMVIRIKMNSRRQNLTIA